MQRHILVVEDRDSLRRLLERALAAEGYAVTAAANGEQGLKLLASAAPFDLVVTDLKLPGASGLEVLRAARSRQPPPPVLVLTAYGTVSTAVEAMKLGAADFLEKPLEIEELCRRAQAILGGERAPVFEVPGSPPILGTHPRLRAALRLLERVAPTESTVLLLGESGTGKELFARAVHGLSNRRSGPFVALNCAAIPETLIENELFGHERGAFTGADRRQAGRFEQAAGGTLFLDEIGELPLAVQGKVLRVLEERTYERVGGGATLRSDARLIAATNRDLQAMVQASSFRSDLYFRLDVFPIQLPPLRERASDIPELAVHLLAASAARHHVEVPTLRPDALTLLAAQPWPGNVRELANVLERATILTDGELDAAAIGSVLSAVAAADPRDQEELRLRDALRASGGNRQEAAKTLGMSYRTLQRRLKEFDLEGFPNWQS